MDLTFYELILIVLRLFTKSEEAVTPNTDFLLKIEFIQDTL